MPAWTSPLMAAARARPGWSLAALLGAVACAAVLPLDPQIQAPVRAWHALPGVPALLDLVRPFGRGEVAVLLALAIAAAGRRRLAGQLLLALLLSAAVTWVLKAGIGRERPNGGTFSFVSGDTSCAFALVPLLARSWALGLGAALVAAGVALSRVVLNYHWPADVLGGAAVGLAAGVAAARLWPERPWRWLADRRVWLGLAAAAWVGAAVWALASPKAGWLRMFLLAWSPALLAWVAWSRLRRRARAGWLPRPWAVAAALAALLLLLAAASTLLDRDEPRNALAAQEMVASGDWLVPTFNGEPRLHKPILPYWLMALSLRTGLPADLACRLPAALCMPLAVLLLALALRRLLPGRPEVAAVAAIALATSPLVVVSGSAATTDAALMLGIALTMWAVVGMLAGGVRWWQVPVAGLGIGWALLSKGPMALLVPLATVAAVGCCAWTAAGRGLVTWRTWAALAGAVLIGAGVGLAWFLPANAATGGDVLRIMIGDHVVKRGLEARESHGGPVFYYLPVLAAAFIAWLPALYAAVRRPLGPAAERPARLVLLAWALPVLLAVSLFQTKLPHYLLPMLWPVAALVALAALDAGRDPGWARAAQRWLLRLVGALLIAVPVVAAALQAADLLPRPLPLPLAALAPAGVAAGLAFLVLARLAGGPRRGLAPAVGIGMAGLVLALGCNAWRLEAVKPAPELAARIRAAVPPGTPVTCSGFDEPSLLFYLGPAYGPVATIHGSGDIRRWLAEPGPGVLAVLRPRLEDAARDGEAPAAVREFGRVAGYNYTNGRLVEVVLLRRGAD